MFVGIPLTAFVLSFFVSRTQEKLLSGIVLVALGINLALTLVFCGWWVANDTPGLNSRLFTLYRTDGFEFFINMYFDKASAVFLTVGAILLLLVAFFAKTYMHRDPGFRRFFATMMLFYTGYNVIVLSGNFETLFVGWEILGITSFLLIAYYRDRYLPVRNGLKVLSFYRLGDICLILAMWMSHHLWHKNITFQEWTNGAALQTIFVEHYGAALFIALAIVVAAAIKSAQFPFSTWLPRAMEGPTTSSAIFYGSLSAHIGVFLLLRTYTFWEHDIWVKGLVLTIGILTSLLATGIARVQSTVKTQIAYASVAQIGLMFVEVALGWHILALVHFAGNAFLRTYQLLVSPSVLNYLLHDMFFHFKPGAKIRSESTLHRLLNGLYILNIKEWNLDTLLYRFCWMPFKSLGQKLGFLRGRSGFLIGGVMLAAGVAALFFKNDLAPNLISPITVIFAVMGTLMVLFALAERHDAVGVWIHAVASQWFVTVAILLNSRVEPSQILYYLGGSSLAALVGYGCLRQLMKAEGGIDLHQYHGHVYEHRKLAMVFLVCCLGVSGFPISPTFIGIDLMFTHIHSNQVVLVGLLAINILFLELSLLRMYTRLFLGQHRKEYHEVAFRSS